MWFLVLCIFARIFLGARETLVKQPPGLWKYRKNIHQKPPNNRTCNKNSGQDDNEDIDEDDAGDPGTSPPGGAFWNAFELLNQRALIFSILFKNCIFQCMGKIYCVEFQRCPLKFQTKHSADSSIKLSGRHTTQTRTSEVRWAARFSGHWVVTSMFA